jgi:hypothetical protein
VVLDNGANDTPETAQPIAPPCEIAGRIEKKGDRDWYAFTAKKGEVYSIEVYGDRLGSPVDLFLQLRNGSAKKMIADLDDNTDLLSPVQFFTRTDDPPRFRFEVPADGKYELLVSSRESPVQAGPRDFYRLRITPEKPDFRLVVMPQAGTYPDACVVQAGGRQYYTVFIWRLDGCTEEIALTVEGLPAGVKCPSQIIGPGLQQATLVVSADPDVKTWTGPIRVKGTATIGGRAVMREARPATISWPVPQENIPTISRLDHALVLGVRADKPLFSVNAGVERINAVPGEKVTIPVKVTRLAPDFKNPVQLTVLNQPGNLATKNKKNQPKGMAAAKDDTSVVVDVPAKVLPGTYTLVIRGEATLNPSGKGGKQRNNPSIVQASAPITLAVLPAQLAKISVKPANAAVQTGQKMDVAVKITRMGDFKGKFKLELVLPPKVKGISAEGVTLPPGKDEATIVLRVDPNATTGTLDDLLMRLTATAKDGTALSQDVKFSVKVVK